MVKRVSQLLIILSAVGSISCSGLHDRLIGKETIDYISECENTECEIRETGIPPNSRFCHLYIDMNGNKRYDGIPDIPLGLAYSINGDLLDGVRPTDIIHNYKCQWK